MAAQTGFSARKVDFARASIKLVRAKWELARAKRIFVAQSEKWPRRGDFTRAKLSRCPRKVNFRRAK